ncbi:hypothetical protein CHUAL_009206 [Chamberlinius hualienensis]
MTTEAVPKYSGDVRSRAVLGELPEDFLRLSPATRQLQEAADHQTAVMLQQNLAGAFQPMSTIGKLNITIVQAELVKNYGVTRMDPYCRLRIGHTVYETHTDHNGARNPRWNKILQCYLPQRVNAIYLEIFDECTFTMDEKIAWALIPISEAVFQGTTVDEWYPLTGKQGDEKEGKINLVISFTPVHAPPVVYPPTAPVVIIPSGGYGMPYYLPGAAPVQPPAPQPVHRPPPITEDDIKQIKEMFPNIEGDVVRSVLEANNGSKDATINALLQINSGN